MRTVVTQASVALVNNQGNIGATLRSLGSSASLRSLATAVVTAGLTAHLSNVVNIGVDLPTTVPLTDRVVQDIQRGLVRATVSAGVSTAVQGGRLDENLISALRTEATFVIGENIAQEIGTQARSGDINTTTQLVAHAALGCITGAVASGNCGSGAVGGAVGEVVGLTLLSDERAERLGNELGEAVQNGDLTQEQALNLAYRWEQQGTDLSVLAASLSAALAGGDVNVAADTAENAVENNALCFGACVAGAIAVISALWTAYDVATTFQEEGGAAALQQLAIDGAITIATAGAGKVTYKIGEKVFTSAPRAWQAAKQLFGGDSSSRLEVVTTGKTGTAGGSRAGKSFTPNDKKAIIEENKSLNNGQTRCENCGTNTVPAQKSQKGVTPPRNETQVDHIIPKSKGGDGEISNGRVLCRGCNRDNSNKQKF